MRPYAKHLIERFNSTKKAEGEENAYQIFLGEGDSVRGMTGRVTPEVQKLMLEDYEEVRKAVFPNQPPDTAPEQ